MKNPKKIIILIVIVAAVGVLAAVIWKALSNTPETKQESAQTNRIKAAAEQVAIDATKCERITGTPTVTAAGSSMVQTSEGTHSFSSITVPVTDKSTFDSEQFATRFDSDGVDRAVSLPTARVATKFAEDSPSRDGEAPKASSLRGTTQAPITDFKVQITKEATSAKTVRLDIYFTADVTAMESENGKIVRSYKLTAERYCGTIEYKQAADGSVSDPRTIRTNKKQTAETKQI